VEELLDPDSCAAAVGEALAAAARGERAVCGVLALHAKGGGFHIKAAGLDLGRAYFAAKVNANFPGNPASHGLPTVQGVVVLMDGTTGEPLAIMDSTALTALRTAAATAAAARVLARRDSRTLTVVGCGVQGEVQLEALLRVLPLERVYACDSDSERAARFAERMALKLRVRVEAASDHRAAARDSDVVVTCTPSRRPLLGVDDVSAGAFVAAVGADHPEKQELEPALMARSVVVVDSLEQSLAMGDLHHAVAAGAMRAEDVAAELGEVLAGKKPGRSSAEDVVVFDSTGVALTDVAAAAVAYERAVSRGVGIRL
jgi:alanine dehydrogenase